MSQIAIVYPSGFGHTKVVAESVKVDAETVRGIQARLGQRVAAATVRWAQAS